LRRTTSVLALLATALDVRRLGQNLLPARLSFAMKKLLVKLLVNAELGATNADAFENVHNHLVELNVIDGTSQTVMTKVTGAAMIGLTTRTAYLSIV
jgi:hypothetical protein